MTQRCIEIQARLLMNVIMIHTTTVI